MGCGLNSTITQNDVGLYLFESLSERNVLCFLCQLLHMSMKSSKINSSDEHVLEMLDPFVQLLINCLQSMDVKVQFWMESVSSANKGPAPKCLVAVDLQEQRKASHFRT